MKKQAYIRIWKQREGRWLSLEEYSWRYPRLSDVLNAQWRSRNPVMEHLAATLQTVKGGSYFPEYMTAQNAAPTIATAAVIDAAGEKFAMILPAPKAGEVAKIVYRTATVTTGCTIDARFETVDTGTGDPSGTLVDTNANAAQVIADADDSKTFVTTLTATATVTRGQDVAIVLVNPGASFGNMQCAALTDELQLYPYTDLFTASWAKTANGPIGGLEYDDGSYDQIAGAWCVGTTTPGGASFTTLTYNNTTVAADEIGIIFQFPFPGRISGFWAAIDLDGDADIVLYSGSGTAELTKPLVATIRGSTNGLILRRRFATSYAFAANTNYRLVVKPTSVTNLSIYEFDTPSAAAMDSFSGGQNVVRTDRVDAGTFAQTTTKRPLMGVFIDQGDDGVSTAPVGRSQILTRASTY